MLLYRFPASPVAKLVTPFLVDPANGGWGFRRLKSGCVGTIGTIGLTWAGYWEVSRFGARIEEMDLADAVAISLPDAVTLLYLRQCVAVFYGSSTFAYLSNIRVRLRFHRALCCI